MPSLASYIVLLLESFIALLMAPMSTAFVALPPTLGTGASPCAAAVLQLGPPWRREGRGGGRCLHNGIIGGTLALCVTPRLIGQVNSTTAVGVTVERGGLSTLGEEEKKEKRKKEEDGWWRDIETFRSAIDAFRSKHKLSMDRIPSERILRSKEGGMALIHAIRRLGGVKNAAEMLDAPLGPRQRSKSSSSSTKTVQSDSQLPGGSKTSSTNYGRFADQDSFRLEIEEFQRNHTSGSLRRVMPSRAQIKSAGRHDLLSALDRYGGEPLVSSRLGMLSSREYGYHCEFLTLLLELRAYIRDSGMQDQMPSLKQLRDDGRTDIARIISKHGGVRVMASRLDLNMTTKPREGDLYWGPFDLDFALEVLVLAHKLAVQDGVNHEITMPTPAQLAACGRSDLHELVLEYGGYDDVSRRLGMDSLVKVI